MKSVLTTPNQPLGRSMFGVLALVWILLAVVLWSAVGVSYLPGPIEVLRAFPALWSEDGLGAQIWTSLTLNIEAISITFVVSLFIAYATVLPVFRPAAALVSSGRFNGMVGLPLVFLAILHDPHWVKLALLVFGTGVFATLSLVRMVQAIPQEEFDHARTLRMGEWQVVWEVVVLGQFDVALDIIRGCAAMMWMMLPMVEGYFRFEGGVGTMLLIDQKHLQLDKVFCIMFVVLAIGAGQDWFFARLRGVICPYADLEAAR